jgi:hypothetical protein
MHREERIDLMPQHLNLALEHFAGSRRTGDRKPLPLGGNQAFEGLEKSVCHTDFDGLMSPMFTRFANIATGTTLGSCAWPRRRVRQREIERRRTVGDRIHGQK